MTFYDILEVSPNASKEIIDKAYKVLAMRYHPDLNPTEDKEQAEENMRILNQAREILTNDDTRAEYDAELQNQYNCQQATNNVSTDDIFESKFKRLPNWLRWVLALPISYLAYIASKFLFSFSLSLALGINSLLLNDIYDVTIATGIFIIMFSTVVPKFKVAATITFSTIIGITYIIIGILTLHEKQYLHDSLIITVIIYSLSIITIFLSCLIVYKNKEKAVG